MCSLINLGSIDTRTVFHISILSSDYMSERDYNVVKKKLLRYLYTTEGCSRKNCYADTDKCFECDYICNTNNYIEIRKRVQDIIVDI